MKNCAVVYELQRIFPSMKHKFACLPSNPFYFASEGSSAQELVSRRNLFSRIEIKYCVERLLDEEMIKVFTFFFSYNFLQSWLWESAGSSNRCQRAIQPYMKMYTLTVFLRCYCCNASTFLGGNLSTHPKPSKTRAKSRKSRKEWSRGSGVKKKLVLLVIEKEVLCRL